MIKEKMKREEMINQMKVTKFFMPRNSTSLKTQTVCRSSFGADSKLARLGKQVSWGDRHPKGN